MNSHKRAPGAGCIPTTKRHECEKAVCRIRDGAERGETVLVDVPDLGLVCGVSGCFAGCFGVDVLESHIPSRSASVQVSLKTEPFGFVRKLPPRFGSPTMFVPGVLMRTDIMNPSPDRRFLKRTRECRISLSTLPLQFSKGCKKWISTRTSSRN